MVVGEEVDVDEVDVDVVDVDVDEDDEEDEDYQTPVRLPFSTTNVENVVIKLVPSIL